MNKRRTPLAMPEIMVAPAAIEVVTAPPSLPAEQADNWLLGPALKARVKAAAEASWPIWEHRYRNIFLAWACDPFEAENGAWFRYAIVSRSPCPGVGWIELCCSSDMTGLPSITRESGGAFYDDSPDHPEGSIEWAKTSARAVKVRNFDSKDWDERSARVYEMTKRRDLPPGDPGVLDAPWKETLISLGYSAEDAHRLALRPTPAPPSPDLPGKLAAIKVLWLQPDHLSLWGIPYRMRDDVGQTPNHLRRAYDEWVQPPYGTFGSKRVDLSDWIWLGSPGWWGNLSKADRAVIEAWLAQPHVKASIPQGPGEWSYIDPDGDPPTGGGSS